MNGKMIIWAMAVLAMLEVAFAAATVSGVKARQRYPWNGLVDIDCTVTGTAGTTYSLTVNARDKVGGANLTVKTVSVEGELTSGNPVSVTSGVYRLVWNADADLPNGFRGEKVSISVTVTDNAKKFMIVDLSTGAIAYQAAAPEGGWDVDEYKGTKMAFVRIEPGTFTQYSIERMPGRKVTITRPYYMGILPVSHKQLRTLAGETFSPVDGFSYTFNDDLSAFDISYDGYWDSRSGYDSIPNGCAIVSALAYRGGTKTLSMMNIWPLKGRSVAANSPIGILRKRTKITKFDLPTEAQVMMAREYVVWNDECPTLCLDNFTPWLGTAECCDPQGDPSTFPRVMSITFFNYLVSAGVTANYRCGVTGVAAGTRFCVYEAE